VVDRCRVGRRETVVAEERVDVARSARGGDAAGVHRAPHVEVVLRIILADRRAGAVDGLVRPPLPGLSHAVSLSKPATWRQSLRGAPGRSW